MAAVWTRCAVRDSELSLEACRSSVFLIMRNSKSGNQFLLAHLEDVFRTPGEKLRLKVKQAKRQRTVGSSRSLALAIKIHDVQDISKLVMPRTLVTFSSSY